MTSLQQYIAEEIAGDHVDGLLTRREAMRRLALLGVGSGAAAALIADLNSGGQELQNRVPGGKIAVVGFCFGGGLVWQLLASHNARLSAAVPFYGPLPDNADFSGDKATAVLAFYGALDRRVTASE